MLIDCPVVAGKDQTSPTGLQVTSTNKTQTGIDSTIAGLTFGVTNYLSVMNYY